MMQAESDNLRGVWMKKLAAVVAACALALLGLVSVGGPAQAYPQEGFTVHLVAKTVHSGATVSAVARSFNACAWTGRFAGQTEADAGKTFRMSFTAPTVHHPTNVPLHVSCVTANPSGGGTSVAVRTQRFSKTVDVRVLPRGSQGAGHPSNGSALPNTGGPNMSLLATGGALVLGGAAAIGIGMRRRRATA